MRQQALVAFVSLVILFTGRILRAEEDPDALIKELGITLGTPAVLNMIVGTWGTQTLPLLIRASGMYYGDSVKGFQGEVGWAFDREGSLKQALSAGFVTSQLKTDDKTFSFSGAGPFYGLNWHGLTAQVGLTFGSGNETYSSGGKTDLGPAQLMAQLGYTFLW